MIREFEEKVGPTIWSVRRGTNVSGGSEGTGILVRILEKGRGNRDGAN